MNTDIYDFILAYEDDLYRFALKLTNNNHDNADDLFQESILHMINGSDSYRPGTNLKAWSFTIMRNTFLNIERHHEIEHRYAEYYMHLSDVYDNVEDLTSDNNIYSLLEHLPFEQSEVLRLFISGYKYCEIAQLLHIPLTIVRNRIHMARLKLRRWLSD